MALAWRSLLSFRSFQEGEMRAYTIKAHGSKVAKRHLHDWLILVILVGIEIILNLITPFHRFVGKDMMADLKYPFKPNNTVPIWSVPIYAVVLPIIIFIVRYLKRRDVHDLHHAILGLLYSVLITGIITDAVKDGVGRPRPDFFWRCFPNGQDLYDSFGNVLCHGDPSVIKEGHKSFPSGHASWSFAGLGFLSLYLAGKVEAFNRRGHASKLCIVLLPLLLAALVAVSRVDDYWHHWQDVFAGGFIGLTVSFLCYLQFFPPPHRTKGWGPYSYFIALEDENMQSQASRSMKEPVENDINGEVTQNKDHSLSSLMHQKEHHKINVHK